MSPQQESENRPAIIYRDIYICVARFLKPFDILRYIDRLCKESRDILPDSKLIKTFVMSETIDLRDIINENLHFVIKKYIKFRKIEPEKVFCFACQNNLLSLVKYVSDKYYIDEVDLRNVSNFALIHKQEKLMDLLIARRKFYLDVPSNIGGITQCKNDHEIDVAMKICTLYGTTTLSFTKLFTMISQHTNDETRDRYLQQLSSDAYEIHNGWIIRLLYKRRTHRASMPLCRMLSKLLDDQWYDELYKNFEYTEILVGMIYAMKDIRKIDWVSLLHVIIYCRNSDDLLGLLSVHTFSSEQLREFWIAEMNNGVVSTEILNIFIIKRAFTDEDMKVVCDTLCKKYDIREVSKTLAIINVVYSITQTHQ